MSPDAIYIQLDIQNMYVHNGVRTKNKTPKIDNSRSPMSFNSDLLAKSDREPVDNLSERHKADSKAKSTKAAKTGDEVQPGHLRQPLVLWE